MADAVQVGVSSPVQTQKPRWSRKVKADNIAGYLFLAPWIIGFPGVYRRPHAGLRLSVAYQVLRLR